MTTRLICCTPVYGNPLTTTVHLEYMTQIWEVLKQGTQIIAHKMSISADLTRSRNRAVRIALDFCFTHLLFWDSDVVVSDGTSPVQVIANMIATGCDFICAAYPRKNKPPIPASNPPWAGMGFTLLSQKCLEQMWESYYDELWYDDLIQGKAVRDVSLFSLMFNPGPSKEYRSMLSEDFSFCERWRRIGGKIYFYDGPGAPLGHIGGHVYTATREEMGAPRDPDRG